MQHHTYRGVRKPDGSTVVTVDHRLLPGRQDLRDHCPVFEWDASEAGSGQLALAILADHLGSDERALSLHQEFKRQVVRHLSPQAWSLSSEQVAAAVHEIDREHAMDRLTEQ